MTVFVSESMIVQVFVINICIA